MRKFLLYPLRLCTGWSLSPRLLGLIGATMLVLLRLTIGWHFYTEGVDKRAAGNWSAAPFFANANGPFEEDFRAIVWDGNGKFRLNRGAMMLTLARYREQVGTHFGFDEAQKAKAQANYSRAMEQYDWVISENAADLEEYELGRERIALLNSDTPEKVVRDGVASLNGQRDAIRREWNGKAAPALKQINTLWANYEADQNNVATEAQREAGDTSSLSSLVPA